MLKKAKDSVVTAKGHVAKRAPSSRTHKKSPARDMAQLRGSGHKIRVYLDNCCYNRPFDDQSQVKVHLETEAKLIIQSLMRTGIVEYVWSFILRLESGQNPDDQIRFAISSWPSGSVVDVPPLDEIRERAHDFEAKGVKPLDALHLACAEFAKCDWFFTVDKGILKKIRNIGFMRVANPVEFILEGQA